MGKSMKFTSEGVPIQWEGTDWLWYKRIMWNVFEEQDLSGVVEGSQIVEACENDDAAKEFKKKLLKAKRLIFTSLHPDLMHQVDEHSSATTIWKALVDIFESRTNARTMRFKRNELKSELAHMKLEANGNVNLHLAKMFTLRTRLKDLQHDVQDADMIEFMLKSLPNQRCFNAMQNQVNFATGDRELTVKELADLIRSTASMQKEEDREAKGRKQAGQSDGKAQGSKDKKPQEQAKGQQKPRPGQTCHICKSDQHLQRACPDRAKQGPGAATPAAQGRQVNYVKRERPDADDEVRWLGTVAAPPAQGVASGMVIEISDDDEQKPAPQSKMKPKAVRTDTKESSAVRWYFDTGANVHLTGDRGCFTNFMKTEGQTEKADFIHGVAPGFATKVAGSGSVVLETEVDGERIKVQFDEVLYVPGANGGLISPGMARAQGYTIQYDDKIDQFSLIQGKKVVLKASLDNGVWGFRNFGGKKQDNNQQDGDIIVNYTIADGVATMKLWHERLGHICHQYLKTMVDKNLVSGMMLSQRQQPPCDACHAGKQKRKKFQKKLQHDITAPNEVVYADLLFPGKGNGTRYTAVLVVMDAYSRYVTVYPLKSKESALVNEMMKQYVVWAERQAGRSIKTIVQRVSFPVKQVLTDKGGEFVNAAIDEWYASRGIVHVKVGPKSSQLNPCERAHQSLIEMTKSMMKHSGLPRSFWKDALENATYVKNRIYHKSHGEIPYERMFGAKPNIHHIRTFGALAYVHVPKTPARQKLHDNATIAFVLGYREDVVGCKVYDPDARVKFWVSDVKVAEDVLYRDRHEVDYDADNDMEWLHFTTANTGDGEESEDISFDSEILDSVVNFAVESEVAASVLGETNLDWVSMFRFEEEQGDADADELQGDPVDAETMTQIAESIRTEIAETVVPPVDDAVASLEGAQGSDAEATAEDDGEAASTAEDENEAEAAVVPVDRPVADSQSGSVTTITSDEVMALGVTQKRVQPDTASSSDQPRIEPKRQRMGLRDASERRKPSRFEDYIALLAHVETPRLLDKDGKPMRASQINPFVNGQP